MRRTTSRSSARTGARRASSRSKRSKRAAQPRLTSRQVREIIGVLLMLAALLGLLAIASHAGSILGSVRDGIVFEFGVAWFVPVAAALALGGNLLLPQAPRPPPLPPLPGGGALPSPVWFFWVAGHTGGAPGRARDRTPTRPPRTR